LSPTELSSLSLHDALPISEPRITRRQGEGFPVELRGLLVLPGGSEGLGQGRPSQRRARLHAQRRAGGLDGLVEPATTDQGVGQRSEEHTSELQSLTNLVCR